jgi:hypothetical protein
MKAEHVALFRRWFFDYVAAYYTDDSQHNETIKLKEEHTKRVCREIVVLGETLNLPAQDMLLAETMALFHDLGRFEQYATYGTFKDVASENHAGLGLRELAEHQVLSVCSDEEQSLIATAIGYHNVRTLPHGEDQRTLFFAKLLRDADKLDIWRVFIDYYDGQFKDRNATIVWGLPSDPFCSPRIVNALRRQEMADTRHMATLNDYKLLQISWVFDVNFRPTFGAVYERKYVQKIAAALTPGLHVEPIVETVLAYLQNRQSRREPIYGQAS